MIWVGLQFVVVVFSDHTLLFIGSSVLDDDTYQSSGLCVVSDNNIVYVFPR